MTRQYSTGSAWMPRAAQAALVFLVASTSPAWAQAPTDGRVTTTGTTQTGTGDSPIPDSIRRPYRGLFLGGDTVETGPGLTLRFGGYGGRDGHLLADQGGSDDRHRLSGPYGGVSADVQYQRGAERRRFTALTSSEFRRYGSSGGFGGWNQSASVAVDLPVGRRTDLALQQGVQYSPQYQLGIGPTLSSIGTDAPLVSGLPDIDAGILGIPSYSYDTSVRLVHQFGRSTLRSSASHRLTTYDSPTALSNGRMVQAGILFTRPMTRYAQLRLGYEHQRTQYGLVAANETVLHRTDLGFAYSRPLSFSRRTSVGGSAGTSASSSERGYSYWLNANGDIRHEIGRTWLLRAAYEQGVQFIELFPGPLYGRTIEFTATGLATRRIDLEFQGGYSLGRLEDSSATQYRNYHASTQLRYAWNRQLATYARYAYYDNSFGALAFPGAANATFGRHVFRVGLTFWVPIYRPMVSNDSR